MQNLDQLVCTAFLHTCNYLSKVKVGVLRPIQQPGSYWERSSGVNCLTSCDLHSVLKMTLNSYQLKILNLLQVDHLAVIIASHFLNLPIRIISMVTEGTRPRLKESLLNWKSKHRTLILGEYLPHFYQSLQAKRPKPRAVGSRSPTVQLKRLSKKQLLQVGLLSDPQGTLVCMQGRVSTSSRIFCCL